MGQACCSGGVPISNNIGLTSSSDKNVSLVLSYDYHQMSRLIAGTQRLDDDDRKRIIHSVLGEVGYGWNERFSTSVLFTWVRQIRDIYAPQTNSRDITSTNGIGDAIFLMKYAVVNKTGVQWMVGVGPKIPLGRTDYVDKDQLILAADLQVGSGAWDWVSLSSFVYSLPSNPNWSFAFLGTFRVNGINTNYLNGLQAYRFGNEGQLSGSVNYRTLLGKQILDLIGGFRYRNTSNDSSSFTSPFNDFFEVPSTGGNWLFGVLGCNLNINPKLVIRLSSEFPIYNSLEGTQLSTSNRYKIAFSYDLNLSK